MGNLCGPGALPRKHNPSSNTRGFPTTSPMTIMGLLGDRVVDSVLGCKGISGAVTQASSPFGKRPTSCRHQKILTRYHSNFLIRFSCHTNVMVVRPTFVNPRVHSGKGKIGMVSDIYTVQMIGNKGRLGVQPPTRKRANKLNSPQQQTYF